MNKVYYFYSKQHKNDLRKNHQVFSKEYQFKETSAILTKRRKKLHK